MGHKDGFSWAIDAAVYQDEASAWQNQINAHEGGKIGSFYIKDMLPKANALLPILYPLNPHAHIPVQNTEPYSDDTFNALIAQYTKLDANGNLVQGP